MIKNILKFSLILTFMSIIIAYIVVVFCIPKILNDNFTLNKIQQIFNEKTDTDIFIKNSHIKITPLLNFYWDIENICIEEKKQDIINLKNLKFSADLKTLTSKNIEADYIFINANNLKYLKQNKHKNKNKSKINFSKIPDILIKKMIISSMGNIQFKTTIDNITFKNNRLKFFSVVETPVFKHKLTLGADGNVYKTDTTLRVNNMNLFLDKAIINVNGTIFDKNGNNFSINSKNIPANSFIGTILYFQKINDPTKKFIENFNNYSGNIDININVKNNELFGKLIAYNLSANTVLFNIPIWFEKAEFTLNKQEINSVAYGHLGCENAIHKLRVINLLSPHREVFGEVIAPITSKLVAKYIPNTKVKNKADAKILYYFKDRKITVDYNFDLPIDSDIYYKNIFLGLENKHRRFYAQTYKDGDNIFLKKYDYSTIENNKINNIILGEGLFKRINGKYKPRFMIYKTNGYAPTSIVGFFSRYVYGGEFKGELKYDFNKEAIIGNFEVSKTIFNKFFVRKATINADGNIVNIHADGKYRGENFNSDLIVTNNFKDKIMVKNMDLFLDKYIVVKNQSKIPKKKIDISKVVREIRMDVENMQLKINAIVINRAKLENIKLIGELKNNVFNFAMTELNYAKGKLTAKGYYNFGDNSSCIDFSANDIDANIVADTLFNLPDQIVGITDATLQAKTKNAFKTVQAHATFRITKGFLPKIGNMEFMAGNSTKIKIQDIINVDLSRKNSLQSDLTGSFDFDNSQISNINITSKQQYLSLFIDGKHNIDNNYTSINIYGKYNKLSPRGVKVFHIPLNLLIKVLSRVEQKKDVYQNKLNKIPSINASKKDEEYFRIKLEGNLNKNNMNIEMKRLK